MKKISPLLGVLICALLVACGGEVRDFQVRSTTISQQNGQIFWDVDVAVYSPVARELEGRLLFGKQKIATSGPLFRVPVSFSSGPPSARFRFRVPREDIPGARLEITDRNKKTVLPVG